MSGWSGESLGQDWGEAELARLASSLELEEQNALPTPQQFHALLSLAESLQLRPGELDDSVRDTLLLSALHLSHFTIAELGESRARALERAGQINQAGEAMQALILSCHLGVRQARLEMRRASEWSRSAPANLRLARPTRLSR